MIASLYQTGTQAFLGVRIQRSARLGAASCCHPRNDPIVAILLTTCYRQNPRILVEFLESNSVAHDHDTSVAVVAVHSEGHMDDLRFQVGDRVVSRVARDKFRAGMLGTVRRVFLSVEDVYDVFFDGKQQPVVVGGDDLERVEQAREREA